MWGLKSELFSSLSARLTHRMAGLATIKQTIICPLCLTSLIPSTLNWMFFNSLFLASRKAEER